MKIIAMIPARYGSTRFPGKMLARLGGKTVIQSTYDAVIRTGLFDDVVVATDSELIYDEIEKNNGHVVMTATTHGSGTDRIAEACRNMAFDVVVNVQGDEPFTTKKPLEKLLEVFSDDHVQIASLIQKLKNIDQINDPNYVKVVLDNQGFALYFSRAQVPWQYDKEITAVYYEHIGIYAYRKDALLRFSEAPSGRLEFVEKIEALRILEMGEKIKMVETEYMGIEIDTPEDLERANAFIRTSKNR